MKTEEQDARLKDDVVAKLYTSEQAELVRSALIKHPMKKYVYVYKRSEDLWEVAVSTEWGGRLAAPLLVECIDVCWAEIRSWDSEQKDQADELRDLLC